MPRPGVSKIINIWRKLANYFIAKMPAWQKLEMILLNKIKLITEMKKKPVRLRLFDTYIENWLWKSDLGTFWQPV